MSENGLIMLHAGEHDEVLTILDLTQEIYVGLT